MGPGVRSSIPYNSLRVGAKKTFLTDTIFPRESAIFAVIGYFTYDGVIGFQVWRPKNAAQNEYELVYNKNITVLLSDLNFRKVVSMKTYS